MRLILKPDWDPRYHYHVNGKKVVITKEDWEKYKDDPTFREIRAEVEAEQAAHPGPEYDEVENPTWRKAYQNLVNGVNLRGRDNYLQPLPQGYTRDEKGVAMDEQGNYYLPVEKATDAPYFVNQEKGTMGHIVPVRYELQQMPDRTIRQLRQPLPVDKVMNVGEEREKAINDYINNGSVSKLVTKHYPSKGYYKDTYYPYINTSDNTIHTISNTKSIGIVSLPAKDLEQIPIDKNNPNITIAYPKNREYTTPVQFIVPFETDNPNYSDFLDLIHNGGFSPTIEWIRDNGNTTKGLTWDKGYPVHRDIIITTPAYNETFEHKVRPSRQEAEKKAVIKVGNLEKLGTFAKGGKLISKYQIGGPYKRDSHTGVIYLPYVSKIKPYDDSKTSVLLNKPILSLSGKSMEMDNKLLTELDDYLKSRNVGLPLRLAILYNVVQEGSTTKSHRNGAYGLLGWRGVRIPGKGINQMEYLYNTIFGKYNVNHWKDGSSLQAFINAETVEDALNALTHGYVRPGLELREFRSKTKYFNEDEKVN